VMPALGDLLNMTMMKAKIVANNAITLVR